jgi:hypothetical protein
MRRFEMKRHGGADAVTLAVQVHPHPRHVGGRVAEVDVVLVGELSLVAFVEHGLEQLQHILGSQHAGVADLDDAAVDAPARLAPGGEMKIGRALGRHALDHAVQRGGRCRRGVRLRGALAGAPLLAPAVRGHGLVEQLRIDAHRLDLHAGQQLQRAAQDLRGGVVHEAQGEGLALGRHGQHPVTLEETHGEQTQDVGRRRLRRLRARQRDPPGDLLEPHRHLVGDRLGEARDLRQHLLERLGLEDQRLGALRSDDRGDPGLLDEQADHSQELGRLDPAEVDGLAVALHAHRPGALEQEQERVGRLPLLHQRIALIELHQLRAVHDLAQSLGQEHLEHRGLLQHLDDALARLAVDGDGFHLGSLSFPGRLPSLTGGAESLSRSLSASPAPRFLATRQPSRSRATEGRGVDPRIPGPGL